MKAVDNIISLCASKQKITRLDIVPLYAEAIMGNLDTTSFRQPNVAIINRWSHAGLSWIKESAWKLVEQHEPMNPTRDA